MTWLDRAKHQPIPPIAVRLGLEVVERGSSITFGPCPECGADTRHASRRDKRLACGMKRPFVGFVCHECQATGDAISLVNRVVGGRFRYNQLSPDKRQRVARWWADYLGAASDAPTETRERQLHSQPEPEPNYPPAQAVQYIWAACTRLDEDSETATWAGDSGIEAARAADMDICRALPKLGLSTGDEASDASIRMWLRNGMRAVFPLYDVQGQLRSLKARSVLPKGKRKNPTPSYPFKGYDKAGLISACPLVRQILATCALPDWWPHDVEPVLEVLEGEKKHAMHVTAAGDLHEAAPLVIGIESGVRFDRLFARLPERIRIFVATDPNKAGADYASKALAAMSPAQRATALFEACFEIRGEHVQVQVQP